MGQWPWNVWFRGYLRLREEIGSAWRCKGVVKGIRNENILIISYRNYSNKKIIFFYKNILTNKDGGVILRVQNNRCSL